MGIRETLDQCTEEKFALSEQLTAALAAVRDMSAALNKYATRPGWSRACEVLQKHAPIIKIAEGE